MGKFAINNNKKMFNGLLGIALLWLSSYSSMLQAANFLSDVQQADSNRLSFYLSQIVLPNQHRNHQNVEELNRVSAWLKGQMQKFSIPCDYQSYPVKQKQYRNVVCRLNVGAAKTIVVGAHYDSHGKSDGADDNASGVAGVLETARILAAEKTNLTHNVEFVFYTLEEAPYFRTEYMGSAVHAQSLQAEKAQISAVMILEMIGYFDHRNVQDYPTGLKWFYPTHANFIGAVSNFESNQLGTTYCNAMKRMNRLECQRLIAPSFVSGVDFSDHLNYWDLGIPAILITDTGAFRNKNYHTKNDRLNTLNVEKMKDVIDGVVLSIFSLND